MQFTLILLSLKFKLKMSPHY